MKRLTIIFVLVLLLVHSQSVFAQTTAQPPAAVVAEARRVAVFVGTTVPPDAPQATMQSDITGHTVWNLQWTKPAGSLWISVDEQDNRVTDYDDYSVRKADEQAFASQSAPSTPESDAPLIFGNVLPELRIPAGQDWRVRSQRASATLEHTPSDQVPLPPWRTVRARYHQNIVADVISADVSRYNGRIARFSSWRSITLPTSTPSAILPSQAEVIAKNAARQYFSSAMRPGDEPQFERVPDASYDLSWVNISSNTTLCGLYYDYWLYLPAVPDPNPNLYDRDDVDHGRTLCYVSIILDAGTGDVLSAGWPFGAGGGTLTGYKPPEQNPRIKLLRLFAAKPLAPIQQDPLVLAVLSGKLTVAAPPGKQAVRFTRLVNGEQVVFAFNATRQRLTWQTGPKTWVGVAVSKPDADALTKELKRVAAAR